MQKFIFFLISTLFFHPKTNAQSAEAKALGYSVLDSVKGATLYKKKR